MVVAKTVGGIILTGIGAIFITNNKEMGEGLSKFYKKLYTKKNTPTMFKAAGIFLITAGLIIAFAPI